MSSIGFERVSKVFGDGTVAVDDLSLVVGDGEFFVLLGASGSGKTTVLRLVAGLEGATEGRILLDDEDVTHRSPPKRDVAMVFQNLALYPHLSVYENLAFGVRMRRLGRAEVDRRVRRAAGILELDHVLAKHPKQLSGGQAQRVALGRAIVREPRAFLMDEPLASLDERLRIQTRTEIADIQREVGVTTLYVTHDQTEAMALGDRIGILRDGVLEQVQTPRELYERPESLFVAGFVGSPPMNLAEATLDLAEAGGLALIFGGHRVRIDPESAGRRPALLDHLRHTVVIGVRPEHLRDAREVGAPDDARMRVRVDRRRTIGADDYIEFLLDAPLRLGEDRDGDDDEGERSAGENVWTARTAAPGEVVELAIEPGRLHVFDPRTGQPITS
jgi:multiple sugar transport system ATP-binding protein